MSLRKNWSNIKAANGGTRVPAGGYVVRIVSATNHEREEYIEIVWDIAEGEHKGAFANVYDRDWAHTHKIYHSERCEGMFRKWLDCVEQSNTGFRIQDWERMDETQMMNALIGKVYGAAWNVQHQLRLWWVPGEQGKREFESSTFPEYYEAVQIRNGEYRLPAEEWRVQDAKRGRYEDVQEQEYKTMLAAFNGTEPPERTADSDEIPF